MVPSQLIWWRAHNDLWLLRRSQGVESIGEGTHRFLWKGSSYHALARSYNQQKHVVGLHHDMTCRIHLKRDYMSKTRKQIICRTVEVKYKKDSVILKSSKGKEITWGMYSMGFLGQIYSCKFWSNKNPWTCNETPVSWWHICSQTINWKIGLMTSCRDRGSLAKPDITTGLWNLPQVFNRRWIFMMRKLQKCKNRIKEI